MRPIAGTTVTLASVEKAVADELLGFLNHEIGDYLPSNAVMPGKPLSDLTVAEAEGIEAEALFDVSAAMTTKSGTDKYAVSRLKEVYRKVVPVLVAKSNVEMQESPQTSDRLSTTKDATKSYNDGTTELWGKGTFEGSILSICSMKYTEKDLTWMREKGKSVLETLDV